MRRSTTCLPSWLSDGCLLMGGSLFSQNPTENMSHRPVDLARQDRQLLQCVLPGFILRGKDFGAEHDLLPMRGPSCVAVQGPAPSSMPAGSPVLPEIRPLALVQPDVILPVCRHLPFGTFLTEVALQQALDLRDSLRQIRDVGVERPEEGARMAVPARMIPAIAAIWLVVAGC